VTVTEYEFPRVTVIHPEHGSYQVDVHCLRSPDGALVLVAFNGVPSYEQVPMVRKVAIGTGDELVDLAQDDITEDMAMLLAANFNANPGTHCVVVQVERPK
jgi:hypothetical protein